MNFWHPIGYSTACSRARILVRTECPWQPTGQRGEKVITGVLALVSPSKSLPNPVQGKQCCPPVGECLASLFLRLKDLLLPSNAGGGHYSQGFLSVTAARVWAGSGCQRNQENVLQSHRPPYPFWGDCPAASSKASSVTYFFSLLNTSRKKRPK